MKHALSRLGLVAVMMMVGCQAMRPSSVPREAKLIGGGTFENLTFPVDGLLLVVDPATNTTVHTVSVTANKPVELAAQEVFGSLLLARYGANGMTHFANMDAASKGSADTKKEAASLPTDSLATQLYFLPMKALELEQAAGPNDQPAK